MRPEICHLSTKSTYPLAYDSTVIFQFIQEALLLSKVNSGFNENPMLLSPQGYGFCSSFLLLCVAIFASLVESQLLLKIDCLDLPVVQGTLKSLLQHHSSKASIFSAFNLPYGPPLTSIHDYWKNHCVALIVRLWLSDLCWQSNISAF